MYSVIPSCCIRIVGVAWDDHTDIGLLPRVDTSTMLFRSITKIHITASDTMTPQPTLYSQQVVVVNNILSPSLTKDISRQLWPRNLCRAISNVFRLSEYLPCQYSMIHSCSSSWLLIITPCTDSLVRTQWCQSQWTWDYFLLSQSTWDSYILSITKGDMSPPIRRKNKAPPP